MKTLILSALIAALHIVPQPREIATHKGDFEIRPDTEIVLPLDATPAEQAMAASLAEALKPSLAVVPAESHEGRAGIFLGELRRQPALEGWLMQRKVKDAEGLPPQGYYLTIWSKGLAIVGADPAGTFNGVQTLLQIARQSGMAWPQVEIRDWPRKPWRGAYLRTLPTERELAELANHKINLLFLEHDAFYDPAGPEAAGWVHAMERAKDLWMDAVPVFSILEHGMPLLYRQPAAVEGEVGTEQIVLEGAAVMPLAGRNLVVTESTPVVVEISGFRCVAGRDYAFESGALQAPFYSINAGATIQRIPGGNIPSRAAASITYTFAPQDAASLCPFAPETAVLLGETVPALEDRLHPSAFHWGGGTIARINRDQRCVAHKMSDAQVWGEALRLMDGARANFAADPRAYCSLDGILKDPANQAAVGEVLAALPSTLTPMCSFTGAEEERGRWDWLLGVGRPFLPVLPGNGDSTSSWHLSAITQAPAAEGIVMDSPDTKSAAFRAAIETAW